MARRTGRGDPRAIKIAQAFGTASGYASRTRKDLDHDTAVAEIREITTDPVLLSEAAGAIGWSTDFSDPATDRVNERAQAVLVDAGATWELIKRYRTVRRERPTDYRHTWWKID